ncbi:MAG: hypothetical protein ACRDPO_22520 [Streptosporangiaceae bacterium]
MNLVSKAARAAASRVISARDVLQAAHQYFWNTKYKNIEGERPLENLFQGLLKQSLERGRRTFLVADRVLGGSLRWTNDGWPSNRSFFVDDQDPEWRDAIVDRTWL